MKKKTLKNKKHKTTTKTKNQKRAQKAKPVKKDVLLVQQEINFDVPPEIEQKIEEGFDVIDSESRYPFTCKELVESVDKQIAEYERYIKTLASLKRQKNPGFFKRLWARLSGFVR